MSTRWYQLQAPTTTFAEVIIEKLKQNREKTIFIDLPSGREVTAGEIVDKSIALAHGLRARGYKEGDVACVFSFNVPEFAIAVYGSALAGMTVMLCNSLYSYYELQHQLIDSSSVLLFIPGNWGHLIISNDDYWADYNHWSGHFQAMASVAKRSE